MTDDELRTIAEADDPEGAASVFRDAPHRAEALRHLAEAEEAMAVLHELAVLEAAASVGTTDTPRIEVRLQGHGVLAGRDHAYLMIIIDDHPHFDDDPRFKNVLPDGRRYATLGAGPRNMMPFFSELVSGVNRKADLCPLLPDTFDIEIQHPEVEAGTATERAVVERLFAIDACYSDAEPYDIVPFPWSDGYNSNSFLSGLLDAGGWQTERPGRVPGWGKPLPKERFGE